MAYIKIWIHAIWSTKNWTAIITETLKPKLLFHIRENANKKEIYIDFINCTENHMHALISLGADQCIGKVMQLIKGESSNWVNKNNFITGKFEWQEEYIAASISESAINIIREYIKNQEEHHRKKSFDEEFRDAMKKYGFEKYLK